MTVDYFMFGVAGFFFSGKDAMLLVFAANSFASSGFIANMYLACDLEVKGMVILFLL